MLQPTTSFPPKAPKTRRFPPRHPGPLALDETAEEDIAVSEGLPTSDTTEAAEEVGAGVGGPLALPLPLPFLGRTERVEERRPHQRAAQVVVPTGE